MGIWYTGGKSGIECWEFGTVNGNLRTCREFGIKCGEFGTLDGDIE